VTARQMQEVTEALRGVTGQWLLGWLKQEGESVRANACFFVPESLGDMNRREQDLGRATCLLELVSQIPQMAGDELRTQMKLEETNNHE